MKKTKNNELVFQILTDDEKTALTLSLGYNKSTWQAGEIMNKAHYKYLEIQARANKFFTMFNEYFEATGGLRIPPDCYINHYFRDFIISTVFERKSPKKAIKLLGVNPFIVTSARDRIFKEELEKLSNSDNPTHQMLCDLIYEFDRWNNIRILPISIQEPSAYKRRNKTRLIKHLKNLATLDEFHIRRFIKKFQVKPGRKKAYIAVLGEKFEGGFEVITIARTKEIVDHISKHLRLYIFNEHVDAETFGFLVSKYLKNPNKDCKVGQQFWPMYRKITEQAYNYLEVNNIIPRRKHLEKAFRDMDEVNLKKMKKRSIEKINDPETRADEARFWVI